MKKILCLILSMCMIAIPPAFSSGIESTEMAVALAEEDFEGYDAATEGSEGEEERPSLSDGVGTYFKAYNGSTNDIYVKNVDGNKVAYLNGKTDWANKVVIPSEYSGSFAVSAKVKIAMNNTSSNSTALQIVVGTDKTAASSATSVGGIGLRYLTTNEKLNVRAATQGGIYGDSGTTTKLDFIESTSETNWVTVKLDFSAEGTYDIYIDDEIVLEDQVCYDNADTAEEEGTKIQAIYFASRAADGTCKVMIDDINVSANYTVTGVEEIQTEIYQNEVYILPQEVKFITDSGFVMLPVEWDNEVTEFSSEEAGEFTVEGTVEGYSEKIEANISVKWDLRDYLIPTETFDSFSDLLGENTVLNRNPIKLNETGSYIAKQGDNYVLDYNNTREYMTVADLDNERTMSGTVVSEFDVDFNDVFSDFYVIHYSDDNKTVFSVAIVTSGGKKRLQLGYENRGTEILIDTTENVVFEGRKAHFKIVIDTEGEEGSLYLKFDDEETVYTFENKDLYQRDSGYDSDIKIKKMNMAFNRSASEAPDKSYYLDNITIYNRYEISSVSNISDSINVGEKYTFPETVEVTTTEGNSVKAPVTWEDNIKEITYDSEGTYTYEGTVPGFDGVITLTVSVTQITIVSVENITDEIMQFTEYAFPETVEALLSNSATESVPVTWQGTEGFTTDIAGTYTFTGAVEGYGENIELTLKVKSDLREYLVPTETFDSFADLLNQQVILVRNPVQLKEPRVYIVKQDDNYVLSYNNTREYMTVADIDNNKSIKGRVVSEFDVDFNEDCNDFYAIHYDSMGATVLSTAIVTSGGKKRLQLGYENRETEILLDTSENLNLLSRKAHFKIIIDTNEEKASLEIKFYDSDESYLFENLDLYQRISGYDYDIEIKKMNIAFNRSASEAPDKAYYLDNIAIYKSYTISSVDNISKKVDVGEKYIFPETVEAITADGTVVNRPVVWENDLTEITYDSEGSHTYEGTVSGYDGGKIKLTLTAVVRTIVSVSDITNEVVKYEPYSFPEKAEALLSDGDKKKVAVKWEGIESFTTDVLGEFTFKGIIENYGEIKLTVTVKPIVIESIEKTKMAFYETEEIKLPDKVFAILNNGEIIEENVVWEDFRSVVTGPGTYTVYGEVEDNVLPAACELHVIAALPKYIDENFEKYKDGYALAFAPWRTANPKILIKSGENGKYATYENLHDFFALYPDPYTGIAAIETSFCIEDGFEDFRYELTEKANSSCVVSVMFSKDKSITLQDEHGTSYVYKNAFPIGKYFEIMLIVNTYNQTYEVYIDNKRISDVMPFKTYVEDVQLWWVRWADRSTAQVPATAHFKDVYITILDNALKEAAELITIPTEVTSDITLPETVSGYSVKWKTSNSDYITENGTVNRPQATQGNKAVTLTATVTGDCGYGIMEYKKTFSVRVMKSDLTDKEIADETYETLTFDKITNEAPDAITSDLKLMYTNGMGAAISWKTSDESVIDSEGKIIVPKEDTIVSITAIITSGKVSREKVFENITVKAGNRNTDIQSVRRAKLALKIVSETSKNIKLPSTADENVKISWKSDNFSVISNSGTVKQPSKKTTVTLTATLTKGSVSEEKAFEVTVTPSSSSESTSGGGGGGGGAVGGVSAPVTPQLTTPIKATPFTDVTSASWEKDAVNHLYQKGIISGSGDGQFYPERSVKREEFIKMVLIALDFEITDKVTHSIPDAPLGSWYDYYLQTAYDMGIVGGYPDGRFGVGDNISRQDMAVILCNAMEKAGKLSDKNTSESNFSDEGEIASYAKEKIALLVKEGYISGMGDGTFSPLTSSTRAQAAQLIYNVIK